MTRPNTDDRSPNISRLSISITGDWQVQVDVGEIGIGSDTIMLHAPVTLDVAPPQEVAVREEEYLTLPVFDATASGWAVSGWTKGERLKGVATQETSAKGALIPDSVIVASATDSDRIFIRDTDYALDEDWGTIGRLPEGQIGEHTKVLVTYRYVPSRIDSIVVGRNGNIELRSGVSQISMPEPPSLAPDEVRLANLWIPGPLSGLSDDLIFPVLESEYPSPLAIPFNIEHVLPRTLEKLRSGEHLKILAWGDSVTDGGYLPSPDDRWQVQFLRQLQERFPKAKIELVTEAWAGKSTANYLNEPPGSPHNYVEKVLAVKPDLIISEFVNDGLLMPEEVETRYSGFLADFQNIGAEWIVLTPHYVRPDWMGMDRETNIDDDPRPYVSGLREFAAKHPVALADASLRWGRLWRQGVPYTTLLCNSINHPDPRGMAIFADSLMTLFLSA